MGRSVEVVLHSSDEALLQAFLVLGLGLHRVEDGVVRPGFGLEPDLLRPHRACITAQTVLLWFFLDLLCDWLSEYDFLVIAVHLPFIELWLPELL